MKLWLGALVSASQLSSWWYLGMLGLSRTIADAPGSPSAGKPSRCGRAIAWRPSSLYMKKDMEGRGPNPLSTLTGWRRVMIPAAQRSSTR